MPSRAVWSIKIDQDQAQTNFVTRCVPFRCLFVSTNLATLLSSHCRCCRNLFHTYRRCPGQNLYFRINKQFVSSSIFFKLHKLIRISTPGSTWVDHHVPVPAHGDGGRHRCRRDHQYTRPSGQTLKLSLLDWELREAVKNYLADFVR